MNFKKGDKLVIKSTGDVVTFMKTEAMLPFFCIVSIPTDPGYDPVIPVDDLELSH